MLNPKAFPFNLDGKDYGIFWQDFGSFKRITVYQNNKRLGWRNLSIDVDEGYDTIRYLIRALIAQQRKFILGG